MTYRVELMPRANRQLQKLPGNVPLRIARALRRLEDDPRPPGVKHLTGVENLWRIRVGQSRIVYEIHDDRLLVLVVRVGHRKDIYRKGT